LARLARILRGGGAGTPHAARLLGHAAARLGSRPPPLPINLTTSVTRRCDSRCSTCGIWCSDDDPAGELSTDQWRSMFRSIGRGSVYFLNVSGGEPTLREDLPDIVRAAVVHLDPRHVHLPVNGVDPDRIVTMVTELLARMSDARAVLSVKCSLDAAGELHDEIRGVAGNYASARETLERLLSLRAAHPGRLQVGVGAVISRLNVHATRELVDEMRPLGLDSIIHEVAENREEMDNERWEITPTAGEYRRAAAPFARAACAALGGESLESRLKAALRLRMIDLTVGWLSTGRAPARCYAGITNAHVGPRGGLWACAVQARTHRMADLTEHDMDFPAAWRSERAAAVRRRIRSGACSCPLANQLYANILLDPIQMARALLLVARGGDAPAGDGRS
jgi:MoaA/NifB/PqqE/SkfB family radical SAM enzyme